MQADEFIEDIVAGLSARNSEKHDGGAFVRHLRHVREDEA
jgi:hypothetical protein